MNYNRRVAVVDQEVVKIEDASSVSESNRSSTDSRTKIEVDDCATDSGPIEIPSLRCSTVVQFDSNEMIDGLWIDIKSMGACLEKFKSEAKQVPLLMKKIRELEKERTLMTDDISDRSKIIETMKQRISVLHEQNNQLAQLTNSGPSEILRTRNALVASLAQLKKLQEQIDNIPCLKAKVATLTQENLNLKEKEQKFLREFSTSFPKGITPSGYDSLIEEHLQLKESNYCLSVKFAQVTENMKVLEKSVSDLQERADDLEESLSKSNGFSNLIKRLEKEKEDLYEEISELKLKKSISQDLNMVLLENECNSLCKANSMLETKLESSTALLRQQREDMILKLFKIDLLRTKSCQCKMEQSLPFEENYESGDAEALPPEFRTQVLRLNQIKLQNNQLQHILHMTLLEKEELEKNLAEMRGKLGESCVTELEHKMLDFKNKFNVACRRIAYLEEKLQLCTNSDTSILKEEYITLRTQISSLRDAQMMLTRVQKQLRKEQQAHEVCVQKYKNKKEKKRELERKLVDSNNKIKSLASELSHSVDLLRKYQDQCIKLEKDIEGISGDRSHLRSEITSLRAQIEVLKFEKSCETDEQLQRNSAFCVCSNNRRSNDDKELTQKSSELDGVGKRVEEVIDRLMKVKETLLIQQEDCMLKINTLKEENKYISEDLVRTKQLMESKLEQEKYMYKELHHKFISLEEHYQLNLSYLRDSELRLSDLAKELHDFKHESTKKIADREAEVRLLTEAGYLKDSELSKCKLRLRDEKESELLKDQIKSCEATIKSLQQRLDESETREIKYELIKQKIDKLLGDTTHNDKALVQLIKNTLNESPTCNQSKQSLQDHNLQLEEQISVLSQWNDKQRHQLEQLEGLLDNLSEDNIKLSNEVKIREGAVQENIQLKRELKEVEMEVNMLQRQVRADVQEEVQVKVEAQTQILAVFNQHNTLLQQQIEDLQSQVKSLGGRPKREKAVSPPPMPDIGVSLSDASVKDHGIRSKSDVEKENTILKERIKLMEKEISKLHFVSATTRRCSSTILAMCSVSIGTVKEEILVGMPREMLLPCSLLADHLNLNASLSDLTVQSWIDAAHTEWFVCMKQKALTPACIQSYISTISRLSHKLLDVIVNFQDDMGNTALHYTAAYGNLPALNQFIQLKKCDPCITNKVGYNALMLLSACTNEVDIVNHHQVLNLLVERTGIDTTSVKDQQTPVMLAAGSGKLDLVEYFIKSGCSINAKDKDGSTPLMFAVQNRRENVVHLLLSSSACDCQAKDNDGQTAKDIAKANGYTSMISLFKKLR